MGHSNNETELCDLHEVIADDQILFQQLFGVGSSRHNEIFMSNGFI